MYAKNVTYEQMEHALHIVNEKYGGNVQWNRFERKGNQFHFTLRVRESSGPGHSLGYVLTSKGNRYRLVSACWHVHGDFFDALFICNPYAVIKSLGKTITINGGNWQDRNVGSIVNPIDWSEKCDCRKAG